MSRAASFEACAAMDADLCALRFAPRVVPREVELRTVRKIPKHTDGLLVAFLDKYCTPAQQKAVARFAKDLSTDHAGYSMVLTTRLEFESRRVVLGVTAMPSAALPLLDLEGCLQARLDGPSATTATLVERFNAASGSDRVDAVDFDSVYNLAYALKVSLDAVPGWIAVFGEHPLPLTASQDAGALFRRHFVPLSPRSPRRCPATAYTFAAMPLDDDPASTTLGTGANDGGGGTGPSFSSFSSSSSSAKKKKTPTKKRLAPSGAD